MKLFDLETLLRENDYPGRGIVLGRSADNACAVMVYFIMGRSQNSRNRVFSETDDGIRTSTASRSSQTATRPTPSATRCCSAAPLKAPCARVPLSPTRRTTRPASPA